MTDINIRFLIVSLALIFMLSIIATVYTLNQPNDLKCKGVIAAENGLQMLLTDCHRLETESLRTYTVKVVFEK